MLVCLIVILLLPKGEAPSQPVATQPVVTQPVQTEPSEAPEQTVETPPTEQAQPVETTLHLVFGGDLNITDRVVASGSNGNDFSQTFLDIAPLFADADIAALNLEGLLADAPYGSATGSAPASLATALSRAGVDVLQLANSCSLNKGLSGLSATIDNVRQAGMKPLGVRKSGSQEQSFVIFEIQGVRIAYVAMTKGMDGMTLPQGSEGSVDLLYTDYDKMYQDVDEAGIRALMTQVNSYSPDITVAMLHWGSKLNDTVSKSQEQIISLLQGYGVDAIVGTHPHYVQKMVFDPQAGTFVAYSLGDLLGDATDAGTEYSVILDLELTRNTLTGHTRITGYSYTPIFTVNEPGKPLRIVQIHDAMAAYDSHYLEAVSASTYEAMKYALERIEARVSGS